MGVALWPSVCPWCEDNSMEVGLVIFEAKDRDAEGVCTEFHAHHIEQLAEGKGNGSF